jgi:hypothetical protein
VGEIDAFDGDNERFRIKINTLRNKGRGRLFFFCCNIINRQYVFVSNALQYRNCE